MNFWIAGGALALLTATALAVPALRRKPWAMFHGRPQSVYIDQLAELDRDATNELISKENLEAARIEIKRRMLKATSAYGDIGDRPSRSHSWVVVLAALVVPIAGIAIYSSLGHPTLPSAPFSQRAEERAAAQDFATLIDRLRERLLSDEVLRVDGWVLLARTYQQTGQSEEAVWAMETLIERGGDAIGADVYAYYAEIVIGADDGIVSPKAEAAIDRALAMDPGNVAATYYKAVAFEQSGEAGRAYALLSERIGAEPRYEPWMDTLAARANQIASRIGAAPVVVPTPEAGPTAEDIANAANMSADEQGAMIQSMVQRLADRLAAQPDDLDGWLKLGNAYRVLGETDKARDAFLNAQRLAGNLPQDDPRHQSIAAALSGLQ